MQEKKNNAIEKTENIADNGTQNLSDDTAKVKNVKKSENVKGKTAKKTDNKKSAVNKQKDKAAVLAEKQKREEERAEMRIRKAEAKAQKKAEKKKAAEEKKAAAKERRQAIKELKIKKKEERLARRDMLKHESKEERLKRIADEKQAKLELKRERKQRRAEAKAERRKLKAEMLAEKRRTKAQAKERRAKERNQRKVRRASNGIGGWLAAVIALGCSCLVLATLLVWNVFMTGNGSDMLAGTYARSFYDLVGYVDNIDVNLSKLTVSSDNGNRQKILSDIVVQANLAEGDLETLPLEDDSRFYTVKFVNQLSDFGKYLNNKLIDGDSLSESDMNTIARFKEINAELKSELNDLAVTLGDGYDFNTLLNGEDENVVLKKFNELQSNAVEYPKMIYDGPFADEPEKTSGNVTKTENPIDENKAKDLFTDFLSECGVSDVNITGTAEGEMFRTYMLEGKADGVGVDGQISDSGKLVTFNWYMNCKDKNFDRDECIEIATNFLQKCGYKSIKPVWTTENDNTIYVNFVSVENDDIIVYADMIKVEVCMERGKVAAMDATKYLENHKDRKIDVPKITVSQAEAKLNKDLTVETSRLAVIPLSTGKEKLAYEFFARSSDGDFYVYIDALNGHELQIFKVVGTDQGTLLL